MYSLFLRKETFFKTNRWYLIFGLISSFVLPLITFTKTVWMESKPLVFKEITTIEPVIIDNATEMEEKFNWNEVLIGFYSLIALLILIKIVVEIASFFKSIKNQERKREKNFTIINSTSIENPFSFFNYVVVNEQQFSEEELHHIIIHESIHIKQKHSFDVLFSRIICAILWVNPIVWLYRKAIIQNLEYIADHETFLTINNKHAYQKTLLKVVTNNKQLIITNQFFQSLIKKRIVMLNTNPSHKKKSWKYAIILPFLIAFTLLFQIETVAQAKENKKEEVTTYTVSSSYSSILTKNTTDLEIKELEKAFSDEKQKLTISNVKRNSNDEIIAIKLEFDFGKTYNRVMERKSDKGINSIKIYINSDEDDDLAYGFDEIDPTPINVILKEDSNISKETEEKYKSLLNLYRNGKKVVLILNGKVQEVGDNAKIDLNDDIADIKEISSIEYEKKYDKKSDKDKLYYEVNTVKTPTITVSYNEISKPSEAKEKSLHGYTIAYESFEQETQIDRIKDKKILDYKKALIIYNEKEISLAEFEKLDPNSIATVAKIPATDYSLKKYGEKAKNGIIKIESQEYFKEHNPLSKIAYDENIDFKLKTENEGFIITKNSKEQDLDFYKSTLAKSNIEFKYSGIKRNDKSEITSISINLKEKESKIKRNIKTSNPIPSLFIGKKNGNIVVEETN
jgi:hypothetical protein